VDRTWTGERLFRRAHPNRLCLRCRCPYRRRKDSNGQPLRPGTSATRRSRAFPYRSNGHKDGTLYGLAISWWRYRGTSFGPQIKYACRRRLSLLWPRRGCIGVGSR
jgi:hypothetical protein